MRKLILMMLIASASRDVMADWAGGWKLLESHGGDMALYVNPSTLHREGNMVKIWYMKDFKTIQEEAADKFMSVTYQGEYDCKGAKSRVLAYTWYSGNMGGGNVIHNESAPEDWKVIASGNMEETIFKYACERKWWQWW